MEQTTFDSSYLIRTGYFLEDLSYAFKCFRGSLLTSPLLLQPYIPWCIVSVFVTIRVAAIHSLKSIIIILTGELAAIHFLVNYFSIRYYNFFLEYSQPSIVSTLLCISLMLKFALIQFLQTPFLSTYLRTPVNMKQTYNRSSYFFKAALSIMKLEQPHEAATFSKKDFFQNT